MKWKLLFLLLPLNLSWEVWFFFSEEKTTCVTGLFFYFKFQVPLIHWDITALKNKQKNIIIESTEKLYLYIDT